MADLSGVLRKTIDGLPRATPQMRAKVYEKARAAIQRQISAANPPLDESVVAARLAALDDAIARTEAHYAAAEGGTADPAAAEPADAAPASPPLRPEPAAPEALAPSQQPDQRHSDWNGGAAPAATYEEAVGWAGPEATHLPDAQGPRSPDAPGVARSEFPYRDPGSPHLRTRSADVLHREAGGAEATDAALAGRPPFFPIQDGEAPEDERRPAAIGAPFIVPPADTEDDWDGRLPAGIKSDDDIPAADLSAPRRRRPSGRGLGRFAAAAGIVLLLGTVGTVGWIYREDIEALLVEPAGLDTLAGAENDAGQETAALEQAPETEETADNAASEAASADERPASNRQFTQRLLPDGTEIDEGPAEPVANAFDEGTNVAAASPVGEATGSDAGSPTISSEIGENPETVGGTPPGADLSGVAAQSGVAETASSEETAALESGEGIPNVAQDAVFYQERTESAPGTQEAGSVVWSLVSESPASGQPAEPAVRAVARVPDENLTMTMTIRRNADPTLPASHVIELLFETPDDFPGGAVSNVQRLALKGTEQARGEPLIGVAGKISDGFFIIALNNLDQAIQNNLALLGNQQWIDIPIAYATGRRALMSIEKGIPGERALEQAIDAWQAKT